MASRLLRIKRSYLLACHRRLQIAPGSPRAKRLAATVAALLADASLPGPQDVPTIIPPGLAVYVRRVPGDNLWVWFKLTVGELVLVTATDTPP